MSLISSATQSPLPLRTSTAAVRSLMPNAATTTQSLATATATTKQAAIGGQSLVRADMLLAAQETENAAPVDSAKEEFLAYQKMTSAEKYRAQFLKQLGLTEEELAAMPPEDREKIEAKLRDMIKQATEEDVRKKQAEDAARAP